ncbi:MAG: hypothetical protein ACK4IX_01070, partial [Candidatus Sericytochromatia bacterium]
MIQNNNEVFTKSEDKNNQPNISELLGQSLGSNSEYDDMMKLLGDIYSSGNISNVEVKTTTKQEEVKTESKKELDKTETIKKE